MAFGAIVLRISPNRRVQVPGDTVRVTAVFSADMAGTGVRFRVAFPSGLTQDHILGVQGNIVSESGTVYHLDFVVEAQGTHRVRVEGSGAVDGAIELEFEGDESVWYTSIPRLITEPIGPGLPGEVIGWIPPSGAAQGHWGRVSGGGSTGAGGVNGNVQYNNGGLLDGASDVKIVATETALAFSGSNASLPHATVGTLRYASDRASIYSRGPANNKNVSLLSYNELNSDYEQIGDYLNLGSLGLASSTAIGVYLGSAAEAYQFNASGALWNGGRYLAFNNTPAGQSLIRTGTTVSILSARMVSNLGDIEVIRTDNVDKIFFGDQTNCNGVVLSVKTGAAVGLRVAGTTEYSFDATAIAMNANNINNIGFLDFGGTTPGSGRVRVANNIGALVNYRSYAGNSRNLIGLSGNGTTFDDITLGDSTAIDGNSTLYLGAKTQVIMSIAGGSEYIYTTTSADWQQNSLVNVGFDSYGSTPAGAGRSRYTNGDEIYVRNLAGTQNLRVIGMGNDLSLGDLTANGGDTYLDAGVGKALILRTGGTNRFTVNPDRIFIANSVTPPTSAPAGGGYLYVENGALKYRGSSDTLTEVGDA